MSDEIGTGLVKKDDDGLTDAEREAEERNYRILRVIKTVTYSLWVLYEVVSDNKFQEFLAGDLPKPISDGLKNGLKGVLEKVKGLFDAIVKFQDPNLSAKLNDLLDAVPQVAYSSIELLDDAEKDKAKESVAKLTMILGLVKDGKEYVLASITLLGRVLGALAQDVNTGTLDETTKKVTAELTKVYKPLWDKRNALRAKLIADKDYEYLTNEYKKLGVEPPPRQLPPAPVVE